MYEMVRFKEFSIFSVQVLGRPLIPPRVRTMTVEDGHVVDVDGSNAAAGAKYAQGSVPTSGVGRNSLFAPTSDDENANQVRLLSAHVSILWN